MSDITDVIDKYRVVLNWYDQGEVSAAMCLSELNSIVIDSFLESIEKGDGYKTFGSCCCVTHPPDRVFVAEFVIQPHGFTAKRVKDAATEDAATLRARLEKAEHWVDRAEDIARYAMKEGSESYGPALEHLIMLGADACSDGVCAGCRDTKEINRLRQELEALERDNAKLLKAARCEHHVNPQGTCNGCGALFCGNGKWEPALGDNGVTT